MEGRVIPLTEGADVLVKASTPMSEFQLLQTSVVAAAVTGMRGDLRVSIVTYIVNNWTSMSIQTHGSGDG
jgi:hypothetical protein